MIDYSENKMKFVPLFDQTNWRETHENFGVLKLRQQFIKYFANIKS